MICSDPMSGSYFIVQTRKFLLIDAIAVTLVKAETNWKHQVILDIAVSVLYLKALTLQFESKRKHFLWSICSPVMTSKGEFYNILGLVMGMCMSQLFHQNLLKMD